MMQAAGGITLPEIRYVAANSTTSITNNKNSSSAHAFPVVKQARTTSNKARHYVTRYKSKACLLLLHDVSSCYN
jgi:hypothetical protein